MAKGQIEFANLTITTKDNKVLIDLVEEIIAPAILNGGKRESRHNTNYFIANSGIKQIVRGRKKDIVIFGRIIKDMLIESEQVYENEVLQKSKDVLHTSPSSIFVITLSDHKVMYLRETHNAPGIEAFQNTLRYFIRLARTAYIDRIIARYKNKEALPKEFYDENDRVTKKHLRTIILPPTVDVIHLPSKQSLDDFVNSFSKIKSIEAKIITTNHEIDFANLLGKIRENKKELKAEIASVKFVDTDDSGLDKKAASKAIAETASSGNARLKVEGQGKNGERIVGNNDDFKISITDATLYGSPDDLATTLVHQFDELKEQGRVVPAPVINGNKKIDDVINNLTYIRDVKLPYE